MEEVARLGLGPGIGRGKAATGRSGVASVDLKEHRRAGCGLGSQGVQCVEPEPLRRWCLGSRKTEGNRNQLIGLLGMPVIFRGWQPRHECFLQFTEVRHLPSLLTGASIVPARCPMPGFKHVPKAA